jgi:hypothetical protein
MPDAGSTAVHRQSQAEGMIPEAGHIEMTTIDAFIPGHRHRANASAEADPEESNATRDVRKQTQEGADCEPNIVHASAVNIMLPALNAVDDVLRGVRGYTGKQTPHAESPGAGEYHDCVWEGKIPVRFGTAAVAVQDDERPTR